MIPKNRIIEKTRRFIIYSLVLSLLLSAGLGSLIPLVHTVDKTVKQEYPRKTEFENQPRLVAGNQVSTPDNREFSQPSTSVEPDNAVSPGGKTQSTAKTSVTISNTQFQILVRLIQAEAGGEPFEGQVAVAAVLLNRIKSGKFPKSISDNVFRSGEFESVSNGYIWSNDPPSTAYKAATFALKGWDPTYGALYFYNPAKTSSRWIWSRPVYTRIGNHYFAG